MFCPHYPLVSEFVGFLLLTTGQYTSNIPSRPEVLAAMFFAAGMAFQRQVDSVNRLRMYRGAGDPLLPGECQRLLLEDVSPTFRSEASTNTEVREVQHFLFFDENVRLLVSVFSHFLAYGIGVWFPSEFSKYYISAV